MEQYPDRPVFEHEMIKKYQKNPYFGGISSDFNCPKFQKDKFYIILMRKKISTSGHWVCCLCEKSSVCYFDSFGIEPDLVVLKRMKSFSKNCYMNDFAYQNITSQKCGFYVMEVVDAWCKGKSFKQIMEEINANAENKEE